METMARTTWYTVTFHHLDGWSKVIAGSEALAKAIVEENLPYLLDGETWTIEEETA